MKKSIFLVILLCFSKSFSQKDYASIYNADSIIKKGISLHDSKQFEQAILEYNKVAKVDPEYLRAQYEKGYSLSLLNDTLAVKTFYENLYKNGDMKRYPSLYTKYASLLDDEKEYDKAGIIFKEGEKYLSNSGLFLYNYAVYLVQIEKNQEAIDVLEKIITINPNYASAHYLLGFLALKEGRITEGSLAFITYLNIAPNGRFAKEAILSLNSKYGENYLEKGNLVFSKSGDDFSEIDLILRNQLPLKKGFKLKSKIDDVLFRQVQAIVEYAVEHKMGDGFFEKNYIPWMKVAVEKNQVEVLSYYMLISLEGGDIGKKLLSEKKKIIAYQDDFLPTFWDIMTTREMEHYGKVQEVSIIYNSGNPFLIGPVVNKKKEGSFILLDTDGNKTGDLNYKNDELNGPQKYFDEKGNLKQEKTYLNGKVDGLRKSYYENGNIEYEENYKEDKLDGLLTNYYPNGGKQCELMFVNDERDGPLNCYYADGSKKSSVNYTNGKQNGEFAFYNELGDITAKGTYKNDELSGDYFQYFDGKKIKEECFYENDKVKNSYKTYYNNGALKTETFYVNGKISRKVENFITGKISQESFYNDKEELETIDLYDSNGNKTFEQKFKSGDLKSGIQFTNNEKPKEINLSKKSFEILNFDGSKYVEGEFLKGKKTGTWVYYHENGNIKIKETYKDGKLDGVQYNYDENGLPSVFCNYTNGNLNGLYEIYKNNKLSVQYNYQDDKIEGVKREFYQNEKLKTESFFEDEELNSFALNYNQDGDLISKIHYINGDFVKYETYDTKGDIENNIDYKNKNGTFSNSYNNGLKTITYNVTNGIYNGKFTIKNKLNTVTESELKNGARNGIYKNYSPYGTLESEYNYYNGYLNGTNKQYDLVGNLRVNFTSIFGEDYGLTSRYYQNKSKIYEYNELNETYDGDYKWFNQKGENIVTIVYENDNPIYYLKLNKQGEIKDKVEINNQTTEIISNYPNGTLAAQINLLKGSFNGKFIINNASGQPEYTCNYSKNVPDGERIEYYANGKLFRKEVFSQGYYEGTTEYFKEDGKKWLTADYRNDELHGNFTIYENGVIKSIKKYNSDELVEISK